MFITILLSVVRAISILNFDHFYKLNLIVERDLQLWDLTAGKLLHDFKCHEGQVQCIDFHPHEFLLATG